MRRIRILTSALVAVALMAITSCGTDQGPTGVAPAADSIGAPDYLLGSLLKPTGLLACRALPEATASATIGPGGGILRVGPHVLYVPPGALTENVAITAVAPSGPERAVRLEPHGLEFERPAYLTLDYDGCSTLGLLLPKRIAYTTDLFEILEYLLSFDNLWTQRVTGRLDHFSQYAVSW